MTLTETEDAQAFLSGGLNRRDILKTGLAGFMGSLLPSFLLSSEAEAAGRALPRSGSFSVSFRNDHTGEGFSGVYRVGGKYLPEAFDRINVVLRDFRTGDVFPIDPRAIDILYMLQRGTGRRQPFDVLSGYRSPKTNAMLNRTSAGVARNSLHLTGQAIDFRMEGYPTQRLRNQARALRAGGVGYYPSSDFVHIDTGQIRHW